LNASVAPAVEERRIRWTTYSNLHAWFVSFKVFLIEFGFAKIESNGELVFLEEAGLAVMRSGCGRARSA
jgi:hypothetical protein